jgi:hypothetical protein
MAEDQEQREDEIRKLRAVLGQTRGLEGEDHRDGPPGYDFDEQLAIEQRMARERLIELGADPDAP